MEYEEEIADILSRYKNYLLGKSDGIEQEEREMIINMYDNNISLEMIAKIAEVSLARVKEILNKS